jgi:hypothetical protein
MPGSLNAISHHGSCLCGGVRYGVRGPLRAIVACHCAQCRRTSGHFVAATSAAAADITLTAADTLTWYRSSPGAERGFCRRCGGNLFWREIGAPMTSIMAGTLDPPTQLSIEKHIFVGAKSDYYILDDAVPKFQGWT